VRYSRNRTHSRRIIAQAAATDLSTIFKDLSSKFTSTKLQITALISNAFNIGAEKKNMNCSCWKFFSSDTFLIMIQKNTMNSMTKLDVFGVEHGITAGLYYLASKFRLPGLLSILNVLAITITGEQTQLKKLKQALVK